MAEYPEVKYVITTADGNIYAFPQLNTLDPNRTGHNNLWINKKWLDKLGLQVPKTLDEYMNVLRAFRDGDPNGDGRRQEVIPYIIEYGGGTRTARSHVWAGLWGLYPNMGYQLQIRNDKIHIYLCDEKFKQVLEHMNMMWREKLLDNAIYSHSADVAMSKWTSFTAGSFALTSNDLWEKYSFDYVALPPPTNRFGDTPVIGLSAVPSANTAVITKADRTPEVSARWIDYFFSDEGTRFVSSLSPLLIGISSRQLPDGSYDYLQSVWDDPRGIAVAVSEITPVPAGGFPYWRNEFTSNFNYPKFVRDNVPLIQPWFQKEKALVSPIYSLEDTEKVNDIRRDLDLYVQESEAKFITGEMGFDKWDEYVRTCERLGIRELEKFYQKAYDQMKAMGM